MTFKTMKNQTNLKEFLITSGEYKNKYISFWKNQYSHIMLMENATCICGETLFCRKRKKEMTNKEILQIAQNILYYKTLTEKN